MHEQAREKVLVDLKKAFRPEFLNRVDNIVVFRSLTQDDIKRILSLQLADLQSRLDERELRLRVTPTARAMLAGRGYDAKMGARPMRRAIQELLEDQLATGVLEGRFNAGDLITATRRGNDLAVSVSAG